MRMVAVLSGLVILLLICALALLAFQSPAPTLHPGSLDCTFNSPQGYVMSTHAENEKDRGVEVAIQDDGHIVALGYCNNTQNEDLMIARYTSYGALDSQFGSGGFAYYDGGGNDRGLGLVLQGDGKMVATGFTQNGSHRDLLLLRYDLNGTVDPTFGNEGVVMFSAPGSSTDIGFGVVWESDGGIFVAGETANATHQDALVIHYTPEGVYDTRFAGTGLFTYGGTNMDRLFACALQPDGKILVTGSSAANEKDDLLLLRMNHDGTLDGTFGVGGVVLYSGEGDNFDYGNWVLVQPDGKILVSGAPSAEACETAKTETTATRTKRMKNDFLDLSISPPPSNCFPSKPFPPESGSDHTGTIGEGGDSSCRLFFREIRLGKFRTGCGLPGQMSI